MPTLRVIFVHGISETLEPKADYTGGFSVRMVEKLTSLGFIPQAATQAQIDQIITFDQAFYADIGADEEQRLLESYHRDRDRLYNFLDKSIETVGFDQGRRFLVSSASDALLYKSDYCRDQIRGRLLEKLTPYVGTNDPVTIVAHSLGTVVAFDVLYYHEWHTWRDIGFKPTNLFTMGSPIALFSLGSDPQGQQETKYKPQAVLPDPYLTRENGVWYNFFDAQDLIGYPLEDYFQNKYKVKDILVQTGTFPIKAHTAYWENDEVISRIAERLKLDYEAMIRPHQKL